ncbi:MAG: ABC transporter, partial [Rhodobacterales bacterium]
DLGLAARHCTRLVVLHNGKIAADGLPQDTLTPSTVKTVFGITAYSEITDKGFVFQALDLAS